MLGHCWEVEEMSNINEFNKLLNEILDEKFPNTIRYAVSSGDYWQDIVIELRENGQQLRYSPYELFKQSHNYEDTIEALLKEWNAKLNGI